MSYDSIYSMKPNREYDQNIINALKALPKPLKTFDGHDVVFDINKRDETIFEHIANKKHHFHVVDINVIPCILRDEMSLKTDRNGKRFRTYIGLRGKSKEKSKYLKIVTLVGKKKKESIYSVYLVKSVDNK